VIVGSVGDHRRIDVFFLFGKLIWGFGFTRVIFEDFGDRSSTILGHKESIGVKKIP
jgi:hypothetical protein